MKIRKSILKETIREVIREFDDDDFDEPRLEKNQEYDLKALDSWISKFLKSWPIESANRDRQNIYGVDVDIELEGGGFCVLKIKWEENSYSVSYKRNKASGSTKGDAFREGKRAASKLGI